MPEIALNAQIGRPIGSSATRRLRRQGLIPGVVYGHGSEPVPVAVVDRELRVALSGESGVNSLLSIRAGDDTFLTLARELQRHPVHGTVIHVDFQIVGRDEVISAEVPVTLVGEAVEIHHEDGLVDQQLFVIPVRARPADIPTVIEVDVSQLTIGAALRIADIELPEGVTTELDEEVTIVVGQAPRVEAVASVEGEGQPEGAEPAVSGTSEGGRNSGDEE